MVRPALLIASMVAWLASVAGQPGAGSVQAPAGTPAPKTPTDSGRTARATHYCILHPEVTGTGAGLCRKCGNPLVPGDPWAQPEYVVDLETSPRAPRPGQPLDLRVAIVEAATRSTVVDFNVVQDRRLHLVLVSQDLSSFAHLHPEQRSDGSWSVAHLLTRPGFYRAFVKFSPYGGLPQVLARTFATGGFGGDLAASIPHLVPDRTRAVSVGDTRVALTIEPDPLRAGPTAKVRYDLSAGGRPVTDLEPYDGGWGQAVVLSEDALDFLRADPVEGVPADVANPRGGPSVRFDVTFPRPGRYRMWFQFKRRGVVWTAPFTVEASPRVTEAR